MTAQGLAAVLGEHHSLGARCTCGATLPSDRLDTPRWFDDHLALAVMRWLETVAGDAAVRESVWFAVASVRDASPRRADDADSWDVTDAAVAALLAAVRAE